jgi:hypothetical protein
LVSGQPFDALLADHWPAGAVVCSCPRIEEGDAVKEKIGVVTDYLNRIGVAVIRLRDGDVRVGDGIRITGKATELSCRRSSHSRSSTKR